MRPPFSAASPLLPAGRLERAKEGRVEKVHPCSTISVRLLRSKNHIHVGIPTFLHVPQTIMYRHYNCTCSLGDATGSIPSVAAPTMFSIRGDCRRRANTPLCSCHATFNLSGANRRSCSFFPISLLNCWTSLERKRLRIADYYHQRTSRQD